MAWKDWKSRGDQALDELVERAEAYGKMRQKRHDVQTSFFYADGTRRDEAVKPEPKPAYDEDARYRAELLEMCELIQQFEHKSNPEKTAKLYYAFMATYVIFEICVLLVLWLCFGLWGVVGWLVFHLMLGIVNFIFTLRE